jgi:hypothetical protein
MPAPARPTEDLTHQLRRTADLLERFLAASSATAATEAVADLMGLFTEIRDRLTDLGQVHAGPGGPDGGIEHIRKELRDLRREQARQADMLEALLTPFEPARDRG